MRFFPMRLISRAFYLPQVRHGNLLCVKTLVESGAWLSQRNALGFTPREDLLNSQPSFPRGRLPKVLRTTLEYTEYAEVSTFYFRTLLPTLHFHRFKEQYILPRLSFVRSMCCCSCLYQTSTFIRHSVEMEIQPEVSTPVAARAPSFPPYSWHKASAAQPHSPTWTAHDGYGSEATTATAASGQSPVGTHQHHLASDSHPGLQPSSRRRAQHHSTNRGRVPDAFSGQEWNGQWSLQGSGGVCEAQSEGGASSGGPVRAGFTRWVPISGRTPEGVEFV